MQKPQFTIGVDISRNTLDIYCVEVALHLTVSNDSIGFRKFGSFCRSYNIDTSSAIVVLEYTGGYEYRWLQYLQAKQIAFVRIPGLAIKRSLGITRGKSDKIDAMRIAQFGDEKYKSIFPEKALHKGILQLKQLLSFRKKLVRENAGYKATIKERKHMYQVQNTDFIIQTLSKKMKSNEKIIEKTEGMLAAITASDEQLARTFTLLKSIKGIGNVNAWMTMVYTENFTSFPNARSYAVYVGVVPFDYSSGTSLRGRKRISHVANKELKQELNQAAKAAIQWDEELHAYADRKLKSKHYGIVLNNVKFKLILRMFAVVKRGEKYVNNYAPAA